MTMHELIYWYLAIINIVVLVVYGGDKLFAKLGSWRVPEKILLLFALLGGSVGMLIGGAVDAGDMADNVSLLEKAGDCILDGETAIILLAQEEYETALTAKLNNFEVSITRLDAAEVAAEVEHAREVERQMAKEAREKLREEKTEAFKETKEKKSEELKTWFSNLGK